LKALSTARWSASHPWLAIAGWMVFVAVCLLVGKLVAANPTQSRDFWIGEAGRAEAMAENAGLRQPVVDKVLITAAKGALDLNEARTAASELAGRLTANSAVASVGVPVISADRTALSMSVVMRGEIKAARRAVPSMAEQLLIVQTAHPKLVLAPTGGASISRGVEGQLGADLKRAEMLTLPVTLCILFIVFGSLRAAGLPLALALTAIAAAFGLYPLTTYLFPDAGGAVANTILMMGMAVGVDYSLFYVKRVREERRAGGSVEGDRAPVLRAAATAGRAISLSAFAVIASLFGLYAANDVISDSIATGTILVVAIAMMSTLTVLPALLTKLGRHVDPRGQGPSMTADAPLAPRLWAAMLKPAIDHPAVTLFAAFALIVALALPVGSLRLSVEGLDTFPRNIPAVATYDRLIEKFPAQGVAHLLVVEASPAQASAVARALTNLAHAAQTEPLFAAEPTLNLRVSADGRVTTLEVPISHGANSPQGFRSLEALRDRLAPAHLGKIPGAKYAVSGQVARATDYIRHQTEHLPWVVGFVLLVTFTTMAVAFRSIVIGVLGCVLNLMSAAAALGALVAFFQYGWAENLFGVSAGAGVSSRIPMFLFVILFGLSMDYQVFVLSRIREQVLAGKTTREAIHEGVNRSAGVVTSAAVIMVSVFVSFMFVNLQELKQIGFGLALAVLLDAFVIRVMILPAAMILLGDRCWWPARPPAQGPGGGTRTG
jgi:RND superfamily putative drug exporter